jgi:hypothetical protein
VNQPITVIIDHNSVTLIQNKKIYWFHDKTDHPVLFAFKNIWATITYNPDLSSMMSSLDPIDSSILAINETPIAAMERLRQIHG